MPLCNENLSTGEVRNVWIRVNKLVSIYLIVNRLSVRRLTLHSTEDEDYNHLIINTRDCPCEDWLSILQKMKTTAQPSVLETKSSWG